MIGEKTLWEREKMIVTSIFHFSKHFELTSNPTCTDPNILILCFFIGWSHIIYHGVDNTIFPTCKQGIKGGNQGWFPPPSPAKICLTLYLTIPTFNDLEKETFRKHCGKRRKCIFSFSHNVFYPSQSKSQILNNNYIVICKCFLLGPVQNFVTLESGKSLIVYVVLIKLGTKSKWFSII